MQITAGQQVVFERSNNCRGSTTYCNYRQTKKLVQVQPGLCFRKFNNNRIINNSSGAPSKSYNNQQEQKTNKLATEFQTGNQYRNGIIGSSGNIQSNLNLLENSENVYKHDSQTSVLSEGIIQNRVYQQSKDIQLEQESFHNVNILNRQKTLVDDTSIVQKSQVTQKTQEKIEENIPPRWKVVIMMAIAFILCNMDKVNMSVAVIPMAQDLGWTALQRGLVSSAFFWGYSLTQVPAGYIATKIGGAMVLVAGVITWSLGTILTPSAAHFGIWYLFAARVVVGLGEGLAPSAVTKIMASTIPESERARAVTAVFGGLDVGSVVGLVACGPLIQYFGWPSVFHVFAILGFVWVAIWPYYQPKKQEKQTQNVNQNPQQQQLDVRNTQINQNISTNDANINQNTVQMKEPSKNQGEVQIQESKQDEKSSKQVPYGKFFKSPAVWAVITAHFSFNWGYYTLLAWLPSYFELALGLNVQKSSLLTLIPYIAMTFMTCIVGPTADSWVKRGWKLTTVRKTAQGISLLGAAICMLACACMSPSQGTVLQGWIVWVLVGVMSLSFMFSAWARAGLYCNHQDLSPKYAGALLGISNTFGALPGVLGVTTVGYLLDVTASWALALFLPMIGIQVVGFVVYTVFASSERQQWD